MEQKNNIKRNMKCGCRDIENIEHNRAEDLSKNDLLL